MREMKEEIKNLFTRERILRLAAFSIDILVLALILSLCTLTLGKPNFAAARGEMDAIVQITDFEARQAQTEVAVAAFSRAYNLSVAVWLGYEVLTQLALGGQTVGKKLCGLRIVGGAAEDAGSPDPAHSGQGLVSHLVPGLSHLHRMVLYSGQQQQLCRL